MVRKRKSSGRMASKGFPNPIDVHVGNRVRMRRLFLGMNQESLAGALGLTFQQVQKYEGGANRISASRLWAVAHILKVDVDYFFVGLGSDGQTEAPAEEWQAHLQRPEAIELVRLYYAIPDSAMREQFLGMLRVAGNSAAAGRAPQ